MLKRRHRYTYDPLVGGRTRAPRRLRGQVAAARLHVPLPGDAPAARGARGAAFEPAAKYDARCTPTDRLGRDIVRSVRRVLGAAWVAMRASSANVC